jgi:hypothetical protein
MRSILCIRGSRNSLTGQGSENASKYAWHYLQRIVARGLAPFDAWMEETLEDLLASTRAPHYRMVEPHAAAAHPTHAGHPPCRRWVSTPQRPDQHTAIQHEHFSRTADRRVKRPKSDLKLLDRSRLDGSVGAWVGNGLKTR